MLNNWSSKADGSGGRDLYGILPLVNYDKVTTSGQSRPAGITVYMQNVLAK